MIVYTSNIQRTFVPKKKLKKILPTHDKIKEQKVLKIFGAFLNKREIWSLSRKKVLAGIFIGMFVCFIPMPLQMILVSLLAIIFNANLPISFALIFISNPLTMPFMYYVAYEFGNTLLNRSHTIEFNFNSMKENFDAIALSLYTGSLVLGLVFALASVIIVNFLWVSTVRKNRQTNLNNSKSFSNL